jgi:hypothetical protein
VFMVESSGSFRVQPVTSGYELHVFSDWLNRQPSFGVMRRWHMSGGAASGEEVSNCDSTARRRQFV